MARIQDPNPGDKITARWAREVSLAAEQRGLAGANVTSGGSWLPKRTKRTRPRRPPAHPWKIVPDPDAEGDAAWRTFVVTRGWLNSWEFADNDADTDGPQSIVVPANSDGWCVWIKYTIRPDGNGIDDLTIEHGSGDDDVGVVGSEKWEVAPQYYDPSTGFYFVLLATITTGSDDATDDDYQSVEIEQHCTDSREHFFTRQVLFGMLVADWTSGTTLSVTPSDAGGTKYTLPDGETDVSPVDVFVWYDGSTFDVANYDIDGDDTDEATGCKLPSGSVITYTEGDDGNFYCVGDPAIRVVNLRQNQQESKWECKVSFTVGLSDTEESDWLTWLHRCDPFVVQITDHDGDEGGDACSPSDCSFTYSINDFATGDSIAGSFAPEKARIPGVAYEPAAGGYGLAYYHPTDGVKLIEAFGEHVKTDTVKVGYELQLGDHLKLHRHTITILGTMNDGCDDYDDGIDTTGCS